MNRNLLEIIKRYKEDSMTKEDQELLEQYIASGKLTLTDFDDLNDLTATLDSVISSDPPRTMDMKFYTMLGEEKAKNQRKDWLKNWIGELPLAIQYALPVLLILVGVISGMQLNKNDARPGNNVISPNLITTVIQGNSTSDRIMAVKETINTSASKSDIVKVLLFSLNNDKSDNVRIAAIEALIKFSESENVRKGLIDAVRNQTSPIVVMNIAQALKMIGSEIPINKYRDMLNSELPSEAVMQIEEGLKII